MPLRIPVLFLLLFALMPATTIAQQASDPFCQNFIDRAFSQTGNSCANLDSENACYAYGDVSVTFYQDGVTQIELEDVFTQISDRVVFFDTEDLLTLESVAPDAFRRGLTVDDTDWGMAVLRVRANLPQQLEQDTAVYIVFGGARIESGVFPEDALVLGNPVAVVANNATLFSSPPGLDYMVQSEEIVTLGGASDFEADGQSADGQWVRVFYRYEREYGDRVTAWVSVDALSDADLVADLPVIAPDTRTHMQSVYLTNVLTRPACEDLPPPSLLVQGPENIETDVFVNDVPIRVTSTAFLQQISANRMRIAAVSGIVILFPETDDEIVLLPGFSIVIVLDDIQSLGIDGEANGLTFLRIEGVPAVFLPVSSLGRLPSNILNYFVQSPTEVCASTIGGVVCTIQIPFRELQRIAPLCEAGVIPEEVCDRFGF